MVLTGETAEGNTREVKINRHREFLQDTHRMRCDLSLPKHWVTSLEASSMLPRRCLRWEKGVANGEMG